VPVIQGRAFVRVDKRCALGNVTGCTRRPKRIVQLKTALPEQTGVLAAIGRTPLVRLERFLPQVPINVFAKLEYMNPGGSVKDRPALQMIQDAMSAGMLRRGHLVIESSSGNMAIGLAQACIYFGLRLICVVDPKATRQNLRILRAYGATIDLVAKPDPSTGDFLSARLDRVRELVAVNPGAFWPNQYANKANSQAHHRTMAEIVDASKGRVDYLFCSASTCGTVRGCAEYVRSNGLDTRIYAVDAVGSVIFGGARGKRLIPGHGSGICPPLFELWMAHRSIRVSDLECVTGCRRLLQHEAILAGGSSGAVAIALEKVCHEIESGSTCVLIFPDRGDRYLDTVYRDQWVRRNLGSIPTSTRCDDTYGVPKIAAASF
jgi:2,3-diaminopropionate biosynthesis protein SbnA